MGAKPFNLYGLIFKDDPHHQSEFVALDIENNPVITNQTGISINLFQLIEMFKFSVYELMIPPEQGGFCFRVLTVIGQERSSGDDVEHGTKVLKVF